MTIRHLRIFIAVVDCGNMSRAAEELFISQPSVSQAVSELEEYYGTKLFERLSRKLYITDQGKRLLAYARHILDSFLELEQEMKEMTQTPYLKIGATVTAGTCFINEIIDRFSEIAPETRVNMFINNTAAMEAMILKSAIDVAIIQGKAKSSDILSFPIVKDELILISGPAYPYAKESEISFEQLADQPFILREKGSGSRALFEKVCEERGVTIDCRWVCNSIEASKEAVKRGRGFTVISKMLVVEELQTGTLRHIPIRGLNMYREFHLIYHKNKYLSKILKEFIRLCKSL